MLGSYYLGAKELGKTGNIFVQIYGMASFFFQVHIIRIFY